MSRSTTILVLAGLWLLAVVQATTLSWLSLPLGAIAPVLVAVLALGYALGPMPGAVFGAWAGLGLDLVPPAAGPVGSWALILTLVGAGMGQVSAARRPGAWLAVGLVGVGAVVATALRASVLWFAGATPPLGQTLVVALAAGAAAILLAPGALPLALAITGAPPADRGGR